MYLVLHKHFFRVTSAHSPKKYKSKCDAMRFAWRKQSLLCHATVSPLQNPFSFLLPTLTFVIHFQIYSFSLGSEGSPLSLVA